MGGRWEGSGTPLPAGEIHCATGRLGLSASIGPSGRVVECDCGMMAVVGSLRHWGVSHPPPAASSLWRDLVCYSSTGFKLS